MRQRCSYVNARLALSVLKTMRTRSRLRQHGADERVLIEDLMFQTEAAIHVARAIGSNEAEAHRAA